MLGVVFPGQGAQSVGMLGDLAREEPSITRRFEQAAEIIGAPLDRYVAEGPEAQLNLTEFTQPAVLTASVALWEIWQRRGGPAPALFAGHSLGEYSALVCTGALSFEEGVRLVNLRGRYMQEAVPPGEGAIAAILGLDNAQVEACCDAIDGVVSPANYNAPGQVAIAGGYAAVEQAIEACKDAGAKRAVMLNLSVPVHCSLMAPASEQLAAALDACALQMPAVPVVHNIDGTIASDLPTLKDKLLQQLAGPVQWVRCVQAMQAEGVSTLVECGPGKVLGGLIKRIDRKLPCRATDSDPAMNDAIAAAAAAEDAQEN
ncbi:MAG: ACP S-malonyltransferase [Pseudomonadota bacterium]